MMATKPLKPFGDPPLQAPKVVGGPMKRELQLTSCPESMTEADVQSHFAPLGADAVERINWTKKRDMCFVVFRTVENRDEAQPPTPYPFSLRSPGVAMQFLAWAVGLTAGVTFSVWRISCLCYPVTR